MRKYELLNSLAWMVVGSLFCVGSIILGLGEPSEPGPGFFPFLMAICLISFSFIHFVSCLRRDRRIDVTTGKSFCPESGGMKRILFTILGLFVFTIAISYMGFALTTFLFILFILRSIGRQKWSVVFLISILITCFSYFIFKLWLKVDLPSGYLGF